MSFLKDFKSEISQAVNELVYNDEIAEKETDAVVNHSENEMDIQKEEEDMARQSKKIKKNDEVTAKTMEQEDEMVNTLDDAELEGNIDMDVLNELFSNDNQESGDAEEANSLDSGIDEELEQELAKELAGEQEEKQDMNEEEMKEATKAALRGDRQVYDTPLFEEEESSSLVSEDVAEVTKGTMIDGNIISEGSMNVYGKIKGNVACRGKLVVAGTIVGSSRAAEVFTNNAKIDGDVTSDGSLKIGNGSIIIGNIYGTSAVIAGAVQGDIDVHGPVIIDGTAVVQGNIRSRSVQINNGAAIEGMISQCYAEIDYAALFDKTFSK